MTVRAGRSGTKGVPREQREQQILDVAAEEFGARGYGRGSVERIAKAVGVSRAMIHTYFDTKDGLYLACLDRAGARLVAAVEAVQDPETDPMTRALNTVSAILATLEPRRHDWRVLYDPSLPSDAPVHKHAQRYRRRLAELGAIGTSEVLAATGADDPADAELVTHLWLDVVGSTVRWWLDRPDETAADVRKRLERILASLAPGRATGSSTAS